MSMQVRPTAAKWFPGLSLGGRLSLLVASIVIGVVASVAYLEVRSFETHINNDLVDAARLGAQSVVDTFAARPAPLDPLEIRATLHDLLEADPVLDTISVFEADDAGQVRVFTSTSTEERSEALDLAGRALATHAATTDRTSTVVMFALPLPRPRTAVVVSVGLESLIQARAHALRVVLGFAVPTIALVTGLVYLVVRRLVARPLGAILRTIKETAAGNRGARTALTGRDEFGSIATRLDELLDQLDRLNQSMQDRIDDATRALSLRNAQLAASRHELLAARESLAHTERVAALGYVAANVAHQAGTPLNLVSGYVQMIRDDPRTDEGIRARLTTVAARIDDVTRVLRTMLDHARAPSGLAIVALPDIIEHVRELAQPRLSRSNIQLETTVDPALPAIKGDATQLEMALLNLVTNALDAVVENGTVSIGATAAPPGVRIEVADTGPGFPPAIMAHLFDPWVTTKPTGQGTGLGLAIVRDVVRAHGGSVSAYNRSRGAVIVIDLPRAELGIKN